MLNKMQFIYKVYCYKFKSIELLLAKFYKARKINLCSYFLNFNILDSNRGDIRLSIIHKYATQYVLYVLLYIFRSRPVR